ncbi:MAG: hypothetical protein ACP5IL_04685 [Syntrophobacteraceae bacterium]
MPEGWEAKALELGALARRRKIDSAQTLLRVLMMHLAEGLSLRATAARARQENLCHINDAALLHRLKVSEQWLHWMCFETFNHMYGGGSRQEAGHTFRSRLVDCAAVSEPGSTGSTYRIHYSLGLRNLRCDTFRITRPEAGEDFKHFDIVAGDLVLADGRYCAPEGIAEVLARGAQLVMDFRSSGLALLSRDAGAFLPLKDPGLPGNLECADWDVFFRLPGKDGLQKGRLLAVKRSEEAAREARKELKALSVKRELSARRLECAGYVWVYATSSRHSLKARDILEIYRQGWQTGLRLKRLKGLLATGYIPKRSEEIGVSWLYGKMLACLLVERYHQEAHCFSPWGYPL